MKKKQNKLNWWQRSVVIQVWHKFQFLIEYSESLFMPRVICFKTWHFILSLFMVALDNIQIKQLTQINHIPET
jgi:hypothetical protein